VLHLSLINEAQNNSISISSSKLIKQTVCLLSKQRKC